MDWLWIPITIVAALCQNVRTAVQKHLKGKLSTNGAAFTRFFYGFPFAVAYALVLHNGVGLAWPSPEPIFFMWVAFGAVTQILGTSFLLHAFSFRNFAVGVAYSKTEVIQAALFGLIFLGDRISLAGTAAIILSTFAVMLISLNKSDRPVMTFLTGWTQKSALLGIASGAFFGISAVAFRAASLSLQQESFLMAAGFSLLWANILQTSFMGLYLWVREREQIGKVIATWRVSGLAGLTGITGSACWFTAMTIQSVAYVRTLGLIELVFTFAVARVVFKERPSRTEVIGIVLLIAGIAMVLNLR